MKVVYAREPIESSIFLVGPTPRSPEVQSWRPEALALLEKHEYDGTVYVPEDRHGARQFDYDDQVQWEWTALNKATVILCWVPRDLKTMPAMTTNVEFGFYVASGKLLFGAPPEAQKVGYLKELSRRFNVPIHSNLEM